MKREFLTPPELPEASECRTLIIPSSKEWLGIFNSALLDATYAYNFEQVNDTDLTVEETAEICRQIVYAYFDSECSGGDCEAPELPEGGRIFRIGLAGRFEELQSGAWVEPQGDAELPPPEPRTNPSEVDRLCLAAKNAANVLQQLYEQSLDDYQDGVDTALAIASQAGLAGAVVLAALGIVTYGVAFVVYGVFSLFYAAMEFLTEDMWNAEFTEKLVCILLECASDDAGVVTFDYDAFMNKLANSVDITDNANELVLFGQIWYMMQWVGSQGLDLAGRTTAISDSDCEYCEDGWCAFFDFANDPDVLDKWTLTRGTLVAGVGVQSVSWVSGTPRYRGVVAECALGGSYTITRVQIFYEIEYGGQQGGPANARNATLRLNQTSTPNDPARNDYPNAANSLSFAGSLASVTSINFLSTCSYDSVAPIVDLGGQVTLKSIRIEGEGTNPFPDFACS